MRDPQLAVPLLQQAADGGHPRAMAILGDLLQTSSFTHEDDKELAKQYDIFPFVSSLLSCYAIFRIHFGSAS